jgi:hypothetical protein
VQHGALFDEEADVALFKEGSEIELSPKGWSVSLWFTTPLPQARDTTFITLSNGDKITARRQVEEEWCAPPFLFFTTTCMHVVEASP